MMMHGLANFKRHEPFDLGNEKAFFCEVGTWIGNVV
jgi:hypothetical protein